MSGRPAREPREWPPYVGLLIAALAYPATVVSDATTDRAAPAPVSVPDTGYEAAAAAPERHPDRPPARASAQGIAGGRPLLEPSTTQDHEPFERSTAWLLHPLH
ncbi:hypothetical protein [Streptomyces lydicus]|uniref:hypothetical protein n=1 Tax=Streptomyces lydicus TaxID=47763 RepID=UPI0036A5A18D